MTETNSFLEFSNSVGAKKLPEKTSTKPKARRVSIVEMRQNIISRATETILQLSNSYAKRGFQAPMAKSVRNGVEVKIGYGLKNQTIKFHFV